MMTTTTDMNNNDNSSNEYWIGIDYGTTNCAAAIYSRTLGRAKWMRLPLPNDILVSINNNNNNKTTKNNATSAPYIHSYTETQSNGKIGRIIPSVIIFATYEFLQQFDTTTTTNNDIKIIYVYDDIYKKRQCCFVWQKVSTTTAGSSNLLKKETSLQQHHHNLWACVGMGAESFISFMLRNQYGSRTKENVNNYNNLDTSNNDNIVDRATIRSVKRTILQEILKSKSNSIIIPIVPLGYDNQNNKNDTNNNTIINFDAITIVAIMLQSIRIAAITYLHQSKVRQKLGLPTTQSILSISSLSSTTMIHCCLGVPATASLLYRTLIQNAAQRAGYISCTCITESTAAAIAYGLFTTTTSRTTTTSTSTTEKQSQDFNNSSAVQETTKTTTTNNILSPKQNKQTILVFDMGGGTTDVTIAERDITTTTTSNKIETKEIDNNDNDEMDFHVCVTVGNDQLGGNDMDDVIIQFVQNQLHQVYQSKNNNGTTPKTKISTQYLLQQCRTAKLLLCGDIDHDIQPADSAVINVPFEINVVTKIAITQKEFEVLLQPILERTRNVIQSALDQYKTKYIDDLNNNNNNNNISNQPNPIQLIDEVILIGGASRVPYIRQLLHEMFTTTSTSTTATANDTNSIELCTSINAMSAVAQGCSVSAALSSGLVPLHEIKSAYMLDTLPYSIGVLLNVRQVINTNDKQPILVPTQNNNDIKFVEILNRGMTLPAAGYETFVLANIMQKGITFVAVEQIISENDTLIHNKSNDKNENNIIAINQQYNILGEFTFLLHRLSKEQIVQIQSSQQPQRSIDIGMTLKDNGEFVASIFDWNDPDHIRKKEWYEHIKNQYDPVNGSNNNKNKKDENNSRHVILPVELSMDFESLSYEQISLILSCFVVFTLYIAMKLTFNINPYDEEIGKQ